MQALSRMYWMTKNNNYKDWAFRISDYYLLDNLPTKAKELRLRDHGCEVVSGLSEVYVMASYTDQQRYAKIQTSHACHVGHHFAKTGLTKMACSLMSLIPRPVSVSGITCRITGAIPTMHFLQYLCWITKQNIEMPSSMY